MKGGNLLSQQIKAFLIKRTQPETARQWVLLLFILKPSSYEFRFHFHQEWQGDDCPTQPSSITRRVFIATDDPAVFDEARRLYPAPRYEFLGDAKRAESAAVQSRYSHNALIAVITDVFSLSYSDYIVCTFSSQVSSALFFRGVDWTPRKIIKN